MCRGWFKQPWSSVNEVNSPYGVTWENKNKQLIRDEMRSASSLFNPPYVLHACSWIYL